MKNICLYFQIHHPFAYRTLRFFEIGESKTWYDDLRTEKEIRDAAEHYYIPTNNFLLNLVSRSGGKFKVSFSISGTALDQFLMYSPNLINSFSQLAETGLVEFLGTTSSHSISSLADSENEFVRQIKENRIRLKRYFDQTPQVFANTDLLFTDQIAQVVNKNGYKAILTNGATKILHWRSPNYLYAATNQGNFRIIFRNEPISNELTLILRDMDLLKAETPEARLLSILKNINPEEPVINIYLNYNALGGSGRELKQQFFSRLTSKIIESHLFQFRLPTEILTQLGPVSEIGSSEPVCWTEYFHSSYHPGNELQKEAIKQLFKLEKLVCRSKDPNSRIDWSYLQTSDHFHLLDENHPAYRDTGSVQSIYKSRYDAFINYMNLLEDFRVRLKTEARLQKNMPSARKPINSGIRQV